MLPTLRSVVKLGGTAAFQDINEETIKEAGITEGQLAVVYGEDATASGPKILHRIAWARSMLKQAGALKGAGHGIWAVTSAGQRISQHSDTAATAQLETLLAAASADVEPKPAKLAEFREQSLAGEPPQMTVRELIQMWGVNRRRTNVVARVNQTLNAANLTTDRDFALGSLDSIVSIVAQSTDEEPSGGEATDVGPVAGGNETASLVVGNIPSATGGIKSVSPHDDLIVAHSEMQAHDYSQLAVMEGPHSLKGAISWESIAKALLDDPSATLRDCIESNPAVVRTDQPLLDAAPAIAAAGYVFVTDKNAVVGIITTADLTNQFTLLTRPFLLLGEIEIVIRAAINHRFTPQDLLEATDPNDDRTVEGAESLTLGEVHRFISNVENFDKLGWAADRRVVSTKLDIVRRIRNEVMHFSPDPLEERDLLLLRTFLNWTRSLYAQQADT
jgi:Mrr N-terminal domain/CBS domain